MNARDWETAFFAMGAVLGEPLECSVASAGEPSTPEAAELVRALRSSSRERRARAIARTAAQVAREVDGMELQ